jgi:hypothetical protein
MENEKEQMRERKREREWKREREEDGILEKEIEKIENCKKSVHACSPIDKAYIYGAWDSRIEFY